VKQNIEVIKQQQEKRGPAIDLYEHGKIHFLNCGRYMILIRIGSENQMQMFFLDYILSIEKVKSLTIFSEKEIAILLEMRDWMLNTHTEVDDNLAVIASIYN
jgi:hypothetical protein